MTTPTQKEVCTNCSLGASDEECSKWPGFSPVCLYEDGGKKPINGWICDGKGNLTKEKP